MKKKEKKKKTKRQLQIARIDELFAAKVKERDEGICQRCGAVGTSVHHILGRDYSVRWDMDNGVTLCYTCHLLMAHSKSTKKVQIFIKWVREQWLGIEKYDVLLARANSVQKINKAFLDETEERLKAL